MSLHILNIGVSIPNGRLQQEAAAKEAFEISGKLAHKEPLIQELYRRSGVKERFTVLEDPINPLAGLRSFFPSAEKISDRGPTTSQRMKRYSNEAGSLAISAAKKALVGFSPSLVTHLITVSCTGFAAPGVDFQLISELNLSSSVERTHIGFMGCHAALNAIRVAKAYCCSDSNAKVLICAVELCSLHYDYGTTAENIVANALFADGAAAVLAEAFAESGAETGNHNLTPYLARVVANGSVIFPDSQQDMTWTIGNNGFLMHLSPKVPGLIEKNLRPWLINWLASHNLRINEIGSWAVHPGGPRILDAVRISLDLSEKAIEPSREILAKYGNMSSPTILFILEQLAISKAPLPWCAMAFGPGICCEVMLLD